MFSCLNNYVKPSTKCHNYKYYNFFNTPTTHQHSFPTRRSSDLGLLGTIVWKPHMCLIRYLNWKDMPEELKEKRWRVVEVLKKL